MKRKRWQIFPPITGEAQKELSHFPPIFQQILFNRGIATAEAAKTFITGNLSFDTNPFNILGMEAAVERIIYAIHHHEKITVYGDYDVDGISSTALLVMFLKSIGGDVHGYIPNRFEEGYGLNNAAITALYESNTKLIISVDCGVRSVTEVEHANKLGLDVIIIDHHHPGSVLPEALAIIDPKLPSDNYPEKNLAGVGLAYKVGVALSERINSRKHRASDYLDLVALGTVADLAPLIGENRSLVKDGIALLRRTNRQGLFSLMRVSGVTPEKATASNIGYSLGPRLNAAGRLESALAAYQLLVTDDVFLASSLAQELDIQNKRRQDITIEIQNKAEQIATEEEKSPFILFAADHSFNPGVVGLAASKLAENYYRPAIVAHKGEIFTRGSCRSIPEFHITEALDQCSDILEHYGGHAAAAGFTVRTNLLNELKQRLIAHARNRLMDVELIPAINIDIEVDLAELKPSLLTYLEKLQPTGYGNPQAKFLSRGLRPINFYPVGKDKKHLKLKITDGWITYDAIAFNQGFWAENMPNYIDIVYTYEMNEYQGRQSLQLNIKDIAPSNV